MQSEALVAQPQVCKAMVPDNRTSHEAESIQAIVDGNGDYWLVHMDRVVHDECKVVPGVAIAPLHVAPSATVSPLAARAVRVNYP